MPRGRTEFWDNARAGTATFTNIGDTLGFRKGGVTRFRGRSTAERGTFINHGGSSNAGYGPGTTEFYDDATAGNGTFLYPFNPPSAPSPAGSGRTDFFDRSSAGPNLTLPRSNFTFQAGAAANSLGGGGVIWFHGHSTAGRGRFTFEPFSKGGIYFSDHASAGEALFDMQERSYGLILFIGDSSATNRTYSITTNGGMHFEHRATAANATITLQSGGAMTFGTPELPTDMATAADATIRVMGGIPTPGVPAGGSLLFNGGSSAGNATITIEGSPALDGVGGRTIFFGYPNFPTSAGNATLIVNGGNGGGPGGLVQFTRGAFGGTAQLVANAGGTFDFTDQRILRRHGRSARSRAPGTLCCKDRI